MKKILFLFIIALATLNNSQAQVFYTETFDGTACVGSGCDPSLVGWTTTVTGVEGAFANVWYLSCEEEGNAVGICGSSCGGSGGDQSIHVGNIPGSPASFACPTGDCGAAYDASAGCETSKRCESPVIDCSLYGTITMDCAYMLNGQGSTDDGTFWYFDGVTWTNMGAIPKSTLGGCSGQGKWTAFSILLPASANGNPNVRIGFQWINNGDNVGTDPSFAVDDITLDAAGFPPVAAWTASPPSPCAGTPVTFTNTSLNGPFTGISWTVAGGVPATGSGATFTTTIATPGPHTVTLIVTSALGTDTLISTITVSTCIPPNAAFTPSSSTFCFGNCIDFTNNSTSVTGPFTSSWSFPGSSTPTSTAVNPTGICYPTVGVFTVTLIVTDANGPDTTTQTITVNNCVSPPTANFALASGTICNGTCLNFTDLSTGVPSSWAWSFPGATPSSDTNQNPLNICYNAFGTFTITLTVTNSAGTSSYSQNIVVLNCNPPNTSFSVSSIIICQNQCVEVNNNTIDGGTYLWSAPGATPSTSTVAEPGKFCYTDTSGVFDITLTSTNAYGTDTYTQLIIVDTLPIIEAFPDQIAITLGDSTNLWVVANNPAVDYAWSTTDTASIGDTTLSSVWVQPSAPGETVYYVYVTGTNGCANVDSVFVIVALADVIAVPTAFSPNNDGNNDFFVVLGPGVKKMNLVVYNRYGQLVFESSDQAKGWDGRVKGNQLDPGVFAWYLEYTLTNGLTGKQKGNVTLIR